MKRCHSISCKSELYAARPQIAGKTSKTLKNSSQAQGKEKRVSSPAEKLKRGPNILPERISSSNMLHFEEIPLEVPKQRSKSTVSDRQPWGHLLNKHDSVFGKFDPLRTLHFLTRELQTNLSINLPGENNLQEIVKAMQLALKRIPPEVASIVHLQQLNYLPKTSPSKDSFNCSDKSELEEIQILIKDSTRKLENTCTHLETICGNLRDEKINLEVKLQQEQSSLKYLQIRVEEMELCNAQSVQNLSKKDDEIRQLKTTIENLQTKLQSSNFQTQVADLKRANLCQEKERLKLEHQLRLCSIEKEKYLAVLKVRDRQIYEIRDEMTLLQESVNEQLIQLHNHAMASVPEEPKLQVEEFSSIWLHKKEEDSDEEENNDQNNKMPTRDVF